MFYRRCNAEMLEGQTLPGIQAILVKVVTLTIIKQFNTLLVSMFALMNVTLKY
jgi:hypothetical protein